MLDPGPRPSTPGPKGRKAEFIRNVKETMIIHENEWIWIFGEFIIKVWKRPRGGKAEFVKNVWETMLIIKMNGFGNSANSLQKFGTVKIFENGQIYGFHVLEPAGWLAMDILQYP